MPRQTRRMVMASRPTRHRSMRCRGWPCAVVRQLRSTGFTLVEMLGALAVLGILATLGLNASRGALERSRNGQAIVEIMEMDVQIKEFRATYDSLPVSLAGIGREGSLDPWGNPYEYGRMADLENPRKDRFLHPLNSDFDLYSKGADGKSSAPLTSSSSYDDIVRAFDGGFVGLGEDF